MQLEKNLSLVTFPQPSVAAVLWRPLILPADSAGTVTKDVLTVSSIMANLSLGKEEAEVRRTVSAPPPQNSPCESSTFALKKKTAPRLEDETQKLTPKVGNAASGQDSSPDKERATEEVLQPEVTSRGVLEAPSVEEKPQGDALNASARPIKTAIEGCPPHRCLRPGASRKRKEVTKRTWQLIVDTNILLDPMDFTYMQKAGSLAL